MSGWGIETIIAMIISLALLQLILGGWALVLLDRILDILEELRRKQ